MNHKYDDIIHLPHPVSARRAGMSALDRAAQFAPFAALTGYEDVIEETGRLTQQPAELTEGSIQHINEKLRLLCEGAEEYPVATVTWFQPDLYKAGGSYQTKKGRVKRVDAYTQTLLFTAGTEIPLSAIYDLQ